MRHHWASRALVFGCLALLGCQPDIGDPCRLPSDCSLTGDRLCDTTFPNGYCTRFNCEPGGCPEEAVCVAYRTTDSAEPACRDVQGNPRFERTFCMKSCERDGDCRRDEGYTCIDPSEIPAWSAHIVERGSFPRRICALPYTGGPLPEDRATAVCQGDVGGSFPDPIPPGFPPDGGGRGDAASGPDAAAVPDGASDAGLEASVRSDAGLEASIDDAPSAP